MTAKEILSNFTGFTCPLFGLQWTPPQLEINVAKDLIIFLEDQRVIYDPLEGEDINLSLTAVHEIRKEVTELLKKTSFHTDISKLLRRLRKRSRDFCSVIENTIKQGSLDTVRHSIFLTELAKLRLDAGTVVGNLSVAYNLDIEDDLSSAIPFKPI